jgi:hypothetical protein
MSRSDRHRANQKSGWICPACERVWAPDVMECLSCNLKIGGQEMPPEALSGTVTYSSIPGPSETK